MYTSSLLLQFMALAGMLLRHKQNSYMYIPASYVHRINWFDALCIRKQRTMYQAIQNYKGSDGAVRDLTVSSFVQSHSCVFWAERDESHSSVFGPSATN